MGWTDIRKYVTGWMCSLKQFAELSTTDPRLFAPCLTGTFEPGTIPHPVFTLALCMWVECIIKSREGQPSLAERQSASMYT